MLDIIPLFPGWGLTSEPWKCMTCICMAVTSQLLYALEMTYKDDNNYKPKNINETHFSISILPQTNENLGIIFL